MKKNDNNHNKDFATQPILRILSVDLIKENLNKQKERYKKDPKNFCIDKAIELLYGSFLDEDEDAFVSIDNKLGLEILRFLRDAFNN